MPTPTPPPVLPEPFAYRPADARRPHDLTAPGGPTLEAPRRAPPKAPPRPARRSWRWFIYALLPLAGLAAAGTGFFLAVPPAALLQSQIAEAVKAHTGRDLVVAGPAAFRFLPAPGLVMEDVSLSAPPEMEGGPLFKAKRLDIAISFVPLLRGDMEVGKVALSGPVFDLRIDKAGRRTWHFAEPDKSPAHPARTNSSSPRHKIAFDELRIENGTLRYSDERHGTSEEISAIALTVPQALGTEPLAFKGRATWSGEPTDFEGTIESARALLQEEASRLKLAVSNRPLSASFDGTLDAADTAHLTGKITAQVDSASALAAWFGLPGSETATRPAALEGQLDWASKVITVTDANLKVGDASVQGTASLDRSGARPMLRGNLEVTELDLDKLRNAAGGSASHVKDESSPEPPAASVLPESETPKSAARVKGYTRRLWSDETIRWPMLGLSDADLALRVGRLTYRDLKLGPAPLNVALNRGTLDIKSPRFELYGGKGTGKITLSNAGAQTTLSAELNADGFDARALLADAAGLDWLSGKGKFALAVTGQGASEKAMVGSLAGKGSFAISDGAVRGFDLDRALRASAKERPGKGKDASPGTSFAALNATFTLTNGVAETKDLAISSPLVTATGTGTVRLPDKELDLLLHPKIATKPQGEAGNETTASIEIPVRVHGPWDKPKASADLSAVVKNPDKAIEAAKEIGKKLKGKGFGDLVRGIVGDGNKGKDGSSAGRDEAKDAPSESAPR